jgi:hypothetical protein
MKDVKIYIQFKEPVGYKYFRLSFGLAVLVIAPTALGIVADSTAMQWVGFVFTLFTVLAIATNMAKKTTFQSIDEARAYLNELEKEWGNAR